MTTETETQATSTSEAQPTLRDFIVASEEELQGKVEETAPETPTETSGEEPAEQEEMELEAKTDETPAEESTTETPDEEKPEEAILAPDGWSDEWKSEFDKLPDEGKQLALTQYKSFQSDYTKKLEPIADINKALEPWQQQIALSGIPTGQLIQRLLTAQQMLNQNPVEGILKLAQSYRVDPQVLAEKLGLNQAPSETDEYIDPQVKALTEKVSTLENTLNRITATSSATGDQSRKPDHC